MDTHFFTVADWWKFYIHKFHRVRAVKLNRKNNTFYTTKLTEWETIISFVNTTVVVVVFLLLSWCLFALKWPYSLAISTRLAWACVVIVSFPSLRETPKSLGTRKKKKETTRRRTPLLSSLILFSFYSLSERKQVLCRIENLAKVVFELCCLLQHHVKNFNQEELGIQFHSWFNEIPKIISSFSKASSAITS